MTMVHMRHPCGHLVAMPRNGRWNAKARRHSRRLFARQGVAPQQVVELVDVMISDWWETA